MKRSFCGHALILTLLGLAPAVASAAEPPAGAAARIQAQEPDRAQLERRFESVGSLIEKSSAARQIEASGEAPALERHARAREMYREAQAAFQAGDLAKASTLLSASSVVMFEAVRLAAPETVTAEKNQTDFNAKLESVKALLAAQKRISEEKPNLKEARESARQIESLVVDAEKLAASDQIERARATLEQAYLLAKASVSSMRMGDTLVRSLNFATKEEEYHYEVDRNDTHQMLVKVLLDDKQAGAQMNDRLQGFLEAAGSLRGQAEAAASRGDFDTGVQILEQSTSEYVKAIRSAGIYIPG
jgi:hypothetical protein